MLALVVGCAANVWDDVARAKKLATFDAVYCVKSMGIKWPERFDVWATLHPEAMDEYEAEREKLGFPGGYEIVAPLKSEVGQWAESGKNIARRVTYRWPGMTGSASSGIYGAKVAIDDGFNVVLAGVPLEANAGHFMPGTWNVKKNWRRGPLWVEHGSFTEGFRIATPRLRGRCKSMSGYTMKVLGAPTPEWLAESQHLPSAPARNAQSRTGMDRTHGTESTG